MNNAQVSYDPTGVFLPEYGISRDDLASLSTTLADIRESVVKRDIDYLAEPETIPEPLQPLDSAFFELPEKLLAAYRDIRDDSQLGRILKTAKSIRDQVDRVVVLGIGGSYMGAKALMDACCEPYFNELSRVRSG